MGTALTEEQLKELGHLTKRLFLCFDADAAGEAATLRGMDLAAARGFDVRVVPLPAGVDPADAADEFDDLIGRPVGYLLAPRRGEIKRALRARSSSLRVQELLAALAGLARAAGSRARRRDSSGSRPTCRPALRRAPQRKTGAVSDRAARRRRPAREAAPRCGGRRPGARGALPRSPRRARTSTTRCTSACAHSLRGDRADDELLQARAELDATAETEHLDADTAKELFLRLEERMVRRELARARRRRPGPNRRAPDAPDEDPRGSARGLVQRPLKFLGRSPVAQLAEHPAVNRRVVGSSPTRGATECACKAGR